VSKEAIIQKTVKVMAALPPLVKSLSGIMNLPKDFNHKSGYAKFLTEKYN
jgi:hypothetical protein